ncbi:type I restriction-modification system, M subunit [Candidatus Magnetomorum sp. HK-1]|nr:type I restriction-modification system, M subunit [Candidatus Magnetomorum sp. HK-1]
MTTHKKQKQSIKINNTIANQSVTDLERYLWEAAHIITGPIDASDYKTYIFPILFFKRVCDVYDEEFESAMDFYHDEDIAKAPEQHRIEVPEGCHWNEVLNPKPGESIYDPACGTGGMLLETVHHIKEHGGDPRLINLKGQEKNLTTEAIARMNLYLHGMEDFDIRRGDTLRDPKFSIMDRLEQFDCVIANPPFSLKEWGHKLWLSDPYNRHIFGLAPKTNADFAWVMHMYVSMKEKTGRMAVVLPHGVLFRSGAEARIRKKLLDDNGPNES